MSRTTEHKDRRNGGQRGEESPQESRSHSRKDSINGLSIALAYRAHWPEPS